MQDSRSSEPEENATGRKEEEASAVERVKSLFRTGDDQSSSKKIEHVPMVTLWSSVAGFLLGGRYGSSAAGMDHIESTQLTAFNSKLDAHRVYHKNMLIGFLRMGSKWGWRMGVFAGTYSLLVVMIDEIREKESAVSYVAAGALTGGVYNIFAGYRSILVGSVLAASFSLPFAVAVGAFNSIMPSNWKQIMRNVEETQAKQLKEKEEMDWEHRTSQLSELVGRFKSQVELADELNQSFAAQSKTD